MDDQFILLHEKIDRLTDHIIDIKSELAVHKDKHSTLSWHLRLIYTTLAGAGLYLLKKIM